MNRALVFVTVLLLLAALGATWVLLGSRDSVSAAAGPGRAAIPSAESVAGAEVSDPDAQRRASARASAQFEAPLAAPEGSTTTLAEAGLLGVRFLVFDQDGLPVEGALVELEGSDQSRSERTDAEGACVVGMEPQTRRLRYTVEAQGYRHEKRSEGLEEELRVRLHRLARLSGRVVDDQSGAPVAAARVSLPDGHSDCPPTAVLADADGGFELEDVPVGMRFVVGVDADGYADRKQRHRLPSGEDLPDLTLRLVPSVDVSLRFVDFASRRPVAEAVLLNQRDLGLSDETGTLDVSTIVTPSTERLYVNASAPGFLTVSGNVQRVAWRENGVAEVPLLRGARWEGRVFDGAGGPVEGASVNVRYNRWGRRRGSDAPGPLPDWPQEWRLDQESRAGVKTDADGAYVTPAVPPGATGCRMIVSCEGFENRVLELDAAPAPGLLVRKDITLVAREGGRVVGELSLNGEPARGRVYWAGRRRSGNARTGADGGFELVQVEPGPVLLSARVERTGLDLGEILRGVEFEVQVLADEQARADLPLVIDWAPISGRVLEEGGQVRAGVQVYANHDDPDANLRAWTDSEGFFELGTPVSEGLWNVGLVEGEGVPGQEVPAGTSGLEFRPGERGVLRVRVLDALTRRALDDFDVYLVDPATGASSRLVDTGREPVDPAGWSFARAPIGPAEIQVVPDDARQPTAAAACIVPPPEEGEVRVELVLELGYELTLHLAGEGEVDRRRTYVLVLEEEIAEALPAAGGNVNLFTEISRRLPGSRSWRSRRVSVAKDTTVRIPGLKAGRYRLVTVMGALEFEPDSFELPLAEPGPVEVHWKPRNP